METQSTTAKDPKRTSAPATGRLLVDHLYVRLSLGEGSEGNKVIVRGEFARAGVATENKRIYPGRLWEREISRLREAMENRRLYGELDHPADGRTSLKRVSHIITNLTLKDGIVEGEAEVFDTREGQQLKALLQAGSQVGVSSRGYGSTRPNERGEEVVQDDYRLVTFDMVAEPADSTAYPSVFYEDKDDPTMNGTLTDEELEAIKAEARAQAQADLRDEFTRDLLGNLARVQTEAKESVRSELLSDPSVASAKSVVDQIKTLVLPFLVAEDKTGTVKARTEEVEKLKTQLSERDLKIKGLEDEVTKLTSVAKEVGYKYYLESLISGDEDTELLRKAIGDVRKYESAAEIKAKVESLREDFQKRRVVQQKLKEDRARKEKQLQLEHKRELERTAEIELKAQAQADKLSEALEQSVQANQQMAVQLYAERKLRGNPKAPKILMMIESANPETKEEVDALIAKFRAPAPDKEQQEQVRARVRALTGGGMNSTPVDEETGWGRKGRNGKAVEESIEGATVSISDFRALSGIER